MIYWADYGSKRSREHGELAKYSLKRAHDNGTFMGRRLHGTAEDGFEPADLAVEPVNRLIFWSCLATGSINVTRMVEDELDGDDSADSEAAIVTGERPTKIALDVRRG